MGRTALCARRLLSENPKLATSATAVPTADVIRSPAFFEELHVVAGEVGDPCDTPRCATPASIRPAFSRKSWENPKPPPRSLISSTLPWISALASSVSHCAVAMLMSMSE